MKINERQHHKQTDQITEQMSANNDKNLQDHSANHNKNKNIHFIIKSASEFNYFSSSEKI